MTGTGYLSTLNPAQYKAVAHPPSIPLQVLAGPGSGKTKVLTSRICHLVNHHGIKPENIVAVTFTNKAANEMRSRLQLLIGPTRTQQLILGTFHAICAMYLRKYGKLIGLSDNFSVCDADESKKIISEILRSHSNDISATDLKDSVALSLISKAKAKGISPEQQSNKAKDAMEFLIAGIHAEYVDELKRSNSLDFDDLLLFGAKLLKATPQISSACQHILVDEFQDTNAIQFELMVHFASNHGCLTVVGDPDQSIYGWRSAEIENLVKMRKEFPLTEQVYLEQNYRSTGSILASSLAIVAEDKARIRKSLHTSHSAGPMPTLKGFATEHEEATFIATEIKRLVAATGGMLNWGDFVILLRFNALSRAFESSLQKEGIPSRVLSGHKFFDRIEIKDLLAYLQLIDNPSYTPAFLRTINVPKRSIGEKTIAEIIARARKIGVSPMEVVERIHAGQSPDIKPPIKRKIVSFVLAIRKLRDANLQGTAVPELIKHLLEIIEYEQYIKSTQKDWESRMENIQELINFATEFEAETMLLKNANFSEMKIMGTTEEIKETPLRSFLQTSLLSTDAETNTAESEQKVAISTCHAAKGLEWPVVMIPAAEVGHFPFYRAEDVNEERRLLYVACTRAQALLYITHASKRMSAGESRPKQLSKFISVIIKDHPQALFTSQLPMLSREDRVLFSGLLDRPLVPEELVASMSAENERTRRHITGESIRCPTLVTSGLGIHLDVKATTSASFSTARIIVQPTAPNPTFLGMAHGTDSAKPESLVGIVSRFPKQPALPGPSMALTLPLLSPKTAFNGETTSSAILKISHSLLPSPPQTSRTRVPEAISIDRPAASRSVLGSSSTHPLARPPVSTGTPATAQVLAAPAGPPIKLASGKKRLGMGRGTQGYHPKKKQKLE